MEGPWLGEVQLRVGDAKQRDVGRGIARIDQRTMQKLGISAGDVVEIVGKRTTSAIAWPAYAEDQGRDIIRVDGHIRKNAGVAINEYVTVRPAKVKEALSVTLAPVNMRLSVDEDFVNFVKNRLMERTLVEGDTTLIMMLGQSIQFTVTKTRPHGVVKVTAVTKLTILSEPSPEERGVPRTTYEDIGGLHEEIQRVREMVELPLRHPELFQRLGIEPPKGVLLHGPPGCGKTLLARAVANESEANFFSINGPEIMCVEPNVMVLTDKFGVITVGDLYERGRDEGDGVRNFGDLRVLAYKDRCLMSNLQSMRKFVGKGYRLKLKNGINEEDVGVSEHQRFLVYDGEATRWMAASEIKEGFWVAAPKAWNHEGHDVVLDWVSSYPEPEQLSVKLSGRLAEKLGEVITLDVLKDYVLKSCLKLEDYEEYVDAIRGKYSYEQGTWVKLPLKLTPELAYLVGLIMSSGCLSEGEASFLTSNEELSLRFREFFKEVFGVNVKVNWPKVLTWYLHNFFNVPYSRKPHSWKVPTSILFSKPEVASAFIAGIYDGCSFYGKSKDGLIGVQFLLLTLGISKTKVIPHRASSGELYKLAVSRSEQRKLWESIKRFSLLYKPSKGVTDHTCFPFVKAIKDIVVEHGLSFAALGDENAEARLNGRMPLSEAFAERYLEIASRLIATDNPLREVKLLLSLRWLKVINKKEVSMEFYDLQVKDDTFIGAKCTTLIYHNSKFYGESEARLRDIFQQAQQNAPSIIFIDELDAIAPKREEVTGEVERRVVAQLLALMDGLSGRGNVIVIGATNRPGALDPALRRPGRFDREIEIGVPDKQGRYEILQIHTRGMPLAADVDLKKLAEMTHGYTGADLAALCRETAMKALRRYLPLINLEEERIPPSVLEKMEVKMEDFINAYKEITPTAMREVYIEVPTVHWSDIGGLEDVKQELREAVEWPMKNPEAFKRLGIKPPKGILLYGPPGCGKTLLAKAVATESEANFIAIKGPEVFSKWVGESEKAIREVFRKAKMAAPAVVFFDEIDALVPRRGMGFADSGVTERVISQLLTEMDGIVTLEDVVVIAATNRPDIVDPAVLRPGRFDRLIYVPEPDEKARLQIFRIYTKDMPLAKGVDLAHLAAMTKNYSGADIEALCREAAMLALRKDMNVREVTMKDFEEAMKKVGPSITPDMEKWYKSFMQQVKQVQRPITPVA